MKLEISFSLKTVSGKKDSEKRYVREFLRNFDIHDTHQFLSLSHFMERESDYLNSGCLTASCTMKILNPTKSEGESHLFALKVVLRVRILFLQIISVENIQGQKYLNILKSKSFSDRIDMNKVTYRSVHLFTKHGVVVVAVLISCFICV